MRLGPRLRLFVLLTSVVPLTVLAFAASRIARERITESLTREQVALAGQLAVSLNRSLGDIERVLTAQVANFRLDVAPDEARSAFLVATWRLLPEVSIAALVDSAGTELTAPVYATTEEESQGHERVGPERLARFRAELPNASGAITRGEPYLPAGAAGAAVPVVFASPYGDGLALAVELSLAPLAAQLRESSGPGRAVLLVNPRGDVLLAAGASPLVDPVRLAPLLASAAADARVDDEVIVATAALSGRDLVVVVAAPASGADEVVQSVLQPTWYIGAVALLAALVAGTLFGRAITDPVLKLRAAAQAVGGGDLARRVPTEGGDEIADLGRSFNQMTEALARNRDEIAAKNSEIEAFNVQLQARVEERTRQLRAAQARLVQSSQLAAVAEMSSGLAHELNNPLAGLLGIVQIVKQQRAGQPDAALLAAAEAEALRCKEIVASLLRFTSAPRPPGERDSVELAALLRDVASLAGSSFRQRDVQLVLDEPLETLQVQAQPDELGRALSQVLGALRTAAAPGGTLRVALTHAEGHAAELLFRLDQVHDQQDDWRAAALGLWAARRVFGAHGATLEEATVPSGRAWRIVMPLDPMNYPPIDPPTEGVSE